MAARGSTISASRAEPRRAMAIPPFCLDSGELASEFAGLLATVRLVLKGLPPKTNAARTPFAPPAPPPGAPRSLPLRAAAMTHFPGPDLACRRGEREVFAGLAFAIPAGGA